MKDIAVAFMHNNLNQITGFHNHVHGFFNDNLSDSQNSTDITIAQKSLLKSEYESNLPNQLRKSVFLMMFGHLEECLYLSWKVAGSPDCVKESDNSLKKYSEFFTKHLKVSLGSNESYRYITDCQFVRNSIIHIAGRVSLSKHRAQLESLIKRNKECFVIENDRIYLTNKGISKFQKSVATFTEQIERAI